MQEEEDVAERRGSSLVRGGVGNSDLLLGFAPDALGEVERLAGAQATELCS